MKVSINAMLAKDTTKIEKGVSDFEAKYGKLRNQYKELQALKIAVGRGLFT